LKRFLEEITAESESMNNELNEIGINYEGKFDKNLESNIS
jgi:hypothetical protein